jgi:hypothetical protein
VPTLVGVALVLDALPPAIGTRIVVEVAATPPVPAVAVPPLPALPALPLIREPNELSLHPPPTRRR